MRWVSAPSGMRCSMNVRLLVWLRAVLMCMVRRAMLLEGLVSADAILFVSVLGTGNVAAAYMGVIAWKWCVGS